MALKYQELAARIEARIVSEGWNSGEQLPTIRRFCAEYGEKQGTIQRALAVLAGQGKLEARRGAGYFVAAPARKPATSGVRIAVYHHGGRPSAQPQVLYSSVVLSGIQEMAERDGATLEIRYGIVKESAGKDISRLDPQVRAVILLGSDDWWRETVPEARVPVVGVGMESAPAGYSAVLLDPMQCAMIARDHFSAKAVRHVRIYARSSPRQWNERARLFAAIWPGTVEWRELPDDAARNLEILNGPDDYPEGIGYWFDFGTQANLFARHFRKLHGESLAEARAVLAFDGKSLLNPHCYEPMDCVTPDWKQAGRLAYREAVRRMEEPGGGAARILLPVRYAAARQIGLGNNVS